jgi:hypothetical protein
VARTGTPGAEDVYHSGASAVHNIMTGPRSGGIYGPIRVARANVIAALMESALLLLIRSTALEGPAPWQVLKKLLSAAKRAFVVK